MGLVTQGAMLFAPTLVSAGLVVALDQASKSLVLGSARRPACPRSGNARRPRVRVYANHHAGIALPHSRYALCFAWSMTVAGTIVLIHCAPALQTLSMRIGLGVALGGVTGNFVDLVRRGAVIDFIDLRVWPVFNIADACIAIGAGAALWVVMSF